MGRISVEIVIDAAVADVWATVEVIERHVDWMIDARAIRFTSERTRGVGTAFECDTKLGPFTLTDRMVVTAWDEGRSIGIRHEGAVTGSGVFTLTEAGDGFATRFRWTETLHFPCWLGGRLGEVVGGQGVLRLVWRRNLRALKRQIESGVPHRRQAR